MSDYDPNFVPKKVYYLVGQKAVLTNREGKILLLQRSDKAGGGGGLWSLPGGALDEGEEPEESIKREIKEETGLEIKQLQPFLVRSYRSDGDHVVIVGYQGEVELGEVRLNWEHRDYKWVSKEEALKEELSSDALFFIKNNTRRQY